MFISEITFPHLLAANDERIERELEWRRVADERRAEDASAPEAVPHRSASRRGIRRTNDRATA